MAAIFPFPVSHTIHSTIPPIRGSDCFPTPWVWGVLGIHCEQEKWPCMLVLFSQKAALCEQVWLAHWMKEDMWPTQPSPQPANLPDWPLSVDTAWAQLSLNPNESQPKWLTCEVMSYINDCCFNSLHLGMVHYPTKAADARHQRVYREWWNAWSDHASGVISQMSPTPSQWGRFLSWWGKTMSSLRISPQYGQRCLPVQCSLI